MLIICDKRVRDENSRLISSIIQNYLATGLPKSLVLACGYNSATEPVMQAQNACNWNIKSSCRFLCRTTELLRRSRSPEASSWLCWPDFTGKQLCRVVNQNVSNIQYVYTALFRIGKENLLEALRFRLIGITFCFVFGWREANHNLFAFPKFVLHCGQIYCSPGPASKKKTLVRKCRLIFSLMSQFEDPYANRKSWSDVLRKYVELIFACKVSHEGRDWWSVCRDLE